MKTAYNRYNIKSGDWFQNKYINIPSKSIYCRALMQKPPDTSVCGDKKSDKYVNLAYRKDNTGGTGGAPFKFSHLAFGTDKW